MEIDPSASRTPAEEVVDLKHWATRENPFYRSKQDDERILAEHVRTLRVKPRLLTADQWNSQFIG